MVPTKSLLDQFEKENDLNEVICPIIKSAARKEKELYDKIALLDEDRQVKFQLWKLEEEGKNNALNSQIEETF